MKIGIYIPDATYDSDKREENSKTFRRELEDEYGLIFYDANIGPSVDIPAFVTWLSLSPWPYVAAAIAVFFSGKKIDENLGAWASIAEKLMRFSKRRPVFDRNGAAVLAVDAIMSSLGSLPRSVQLIGYAVIHIHEYNERQNIERIEEISEEMQPLFLGFAVHVFEIEADSKTFRVFVHGHDVEIHDMSSRRQ